MTEIPAEGLRYSPHTRASLDLVMAREGVGEGEALRRLIAYGRLVYDTLLVEDGELIVTNRDGTRHRIRPVEKLDERSARPKRAKLGTGGGGAAPQRADPSPMVGEGSAFQRDR